MCVVCCLLFVVACVLRVACGALLYAWCFVLDVCDWRLVFVVGRLVFSVRCFGVLCLALLCFGVWCFCVLVCWLLLFVVCWFVPWCCGALCLVFVEWCLVRVVLVCVAR